MKTALSANNTHSKFSTGDEKIPGMRLNSEVHPLKKEDVKPLLALQQTDSHI